MDEEEPLVGGLKEFIPQKHEIVNKEWFSKPANSCWFSLLITAVAAGFLYVCFALTGLIEIFAGNEVCPIMNLSDLTDQVPVLARQFWLKSGRQKLELFESFKRTHNKKYSSSEEEQKRLDIFLGNLDRIDELNAKRNGATYGLTKFADLTKEEFSDRNKLQFESNFQVLADDTVGYVAFSDVISDGLVDDSAKIPCEWDWRTKGAVTPVQNQGLCGDCFSFATVGSVEGTNFLATGNLVELSEQEITSCGTVDQFVSTISPTILSDEENSDDEESQRRLSSSSSSSSLELNGCEGGSLAGAFADVYQNGLVPASAYPYESFYGTAPACDEAVVESASSEAVHIGGWTWILDNDNDLDAGASISTIKRALMSLGPIAVGINAEQMQFYMGGVDHASLCIAQPPDHAVLLVGFGYSRGGPYWLIKNSWGTSWGEDGYYRIAEELGACYLQDMALVGLPAAAAATR